MTNHMADITPVQRTTSTETVQQAIIELVRQTGEQLQERHGREVEALQKAATKAGTGNVQELFRLRQEWGF